MVWLTQQQLQALLEFVRNCYAWRDQATFVTHLLHAIPTLIPSEVTSYDEINFESERLLDVTRVEPCTAVAMGPHLGV